MAFGLLRVISRRYRAATLLTAPPQSADISCGGWSCVCVPNSISYNARPCCCVRVPSSLPSGRYSLLGPDFHRLDRTSLRLAHLFNHLVGTRKQHGRRYGATSIIFRGTSVS